MKKKIVKYSIILLIISAIFIKIKSLLFAEDREVYKTPEKNVAIALNYHRIRENNLFNKSIEFITQDKEFTTYSVDDESFEKQLDYLIKHNAYFATLKELEEFSKSGKYPKNCVWISFDDVDKSVYEVAFPILKEKNIPFTLFIISSKVGSKNFNNLEMATWDDLKEMRNSGLATFGSHTHDMHYLEDNKATFLDENNYEKFEKDIKLSKKIIEKKLEITIDSIAYPFGETSDDVNEIAERSGFDYAYILSPNPITQNDSAYYQNRYLITESNFYKILEPWINR